MVYHVNDVFWHPQAAWPIPCLWPLPRHRVLGGHSHTKSVCLPEPYANLVVVIALTAAVVLVVLVLVIDLVIAAAVVVVVVSVVAVVLLLAMFAPIMQSFFSGGISMPILFVLD